MSFHFPDLPPNVPVAPILAPRVAAPALPDVRPTTMIVDRFLAWMPRATASARAEGAGALARAYLYSDLRDDERRAAEGALTIMLDDPSIHVRRNISEALAAHPQAPRHIVLTLAQDAPDAALPVLVLSPVLQDADLIDLLAMRGEEEQAAIAARCDLSAALTAAISEIAGAWACTVLARNPKARFTRSIFARITERHGADSDVRDALLDRPDLPIGERQRLLMKLAESLGKAASRQFSLGDERVRHMTREACDRATLKLAGESDADMMPLVVHLRSTGQLTPGLILRGLLIGDLEFVAASFSELTGVEPNRVLRMMSEPSRAGFRALFRDAGLPQSLLGVFQSGLATWEECYALGLDGAEARFLVAERARATAAPSAAGEAFSLLNRMAAEAARDAAAERFADYAEPLRLAAA